MIAIAGAKGGCGKTTTTLGLARALDREGLLSFVIDADRQLPNLHAAADVSREPTIAAIERTDDVSEVAHPLPDAPKAGVLPAPADAPAFDFGATLNRFAEDPVHALVDCPAGAGPGVATPISAAERVVVVTTGTKRSLESARKTVDIARRLDTPVAGAILNKCSKVPLQFRSEFEIPVLGTVPACHDPHRNEGAKAAYDDIVTELLTQTGDPTEIIEARNSMTLSTGLGPIDRFLDGGLPSGSTVAISAEPGAPSELILHALTATRGTLYLTTEQSRPQVHDSIQTSFVRTGQPTVRELSGESQIEDAISLLRKLPERTNVIIDTMDDLEQYGQDAYRRFLDTLLDAVQSTESIAMLHTLDRSPTPRNRVTTERFVDTMLRLETDQSGERVSHHLSVTKSVRNDLIEPEDRLDITECLSRPGNSISDSLLNGAD